MDAKYKQPPSGGCVLKPNGFVETRNRDLQPPSGGCVLKLRYVHQGRIGYKAATFGWLCVETKLMKSRTEPTKGSHLRVAVC